MKFQGVFRMLMYKLVYNSPTYAVPLMSHIRFNAAFFFFFFF